MTKIKRLLTYTCIAILFFSCSSESNDETPPVAFESFSVSKNISFTDTPIILNINGSNFESSELIFTNDNVESKKINETTYEITASEALIEQIRIRLINGGDIQSKSVMLEFIEHGVLNSNVVEGIKVDTHKTERLLEILGEPDGKIEYSSGTSSGWVYTSGVTFIVTKATNTIATASINTYDRAIQAGDKSVLVKAYPYLINGTFDFSDFGRNKIDNIVDSLGLPTFIYTGTLPVGTFSYKNQIRPPSSTARGLYQYVYFNNSDIQNGMSVVFFSNNIDDYMGENITDFLIF